MSENESLNELNLVWASDDNYAFLAGVSITSALEHSKDFETVNIWVLDDDISEAERQRLKQCVFEYNRTVFFITMKDYLKKIKDLNARSWGKNKSYSTYSRIFLATILKEYNVKRAIYVDCDIVFDDSIRALAEWDMKGKPLALAIDYNRVEIRKLLNIGFDEKYYNAGLMLIDIDRWQECQCEKRIVNHMAKIGANYPFVDQDLINCVLKDEIDILPLRYNVNPRVMQYSYKNLCKIYGMNEHNYYTQNEYNEVRKNKPVGYHCSDPQKGRPWEEGNSADYSDVWNYYFDKSVWKECYIKKKYSPFLINRINQNLEKILPQFIYVCILEYVAKNAMKKLISKYYSSNENSASTD